MVVRVIDANYFLVAYLFLLGLMHIGVIKTLYYNQLLPRIISGSSCGSIIAGILCTRTDEEISEMFQFDKFNFVSLGSRFNGAYRHLDVVSSFSAR